MKEIFACAAVVSLLACSGSDPMSGDYASVDPDAVLSFDYATSDFRVAAFRFTEGDPFQVTVQTKRDNSFRHCLGDETFAQAIAPFESLKIERHIERAEYAKLSTRFSYHRLSYTTAPPMDGFELVLSPLPNGHLAMQHEDAGYELTLVKSAVDRLGRSCGNAHARTESSK